VLGRALDRTRRAGVGAADHDLRRCNADARERWRVEIAAAAREGFARAAGPAVGADPGAVRRRGVGRPPRRRTATLGDRLAVAAAIYLPWGAAPVDLTLRSEYGTAALSGFVQLLATY
jgi:hypothetical protein